MEFYSRNPMDVLSMMNEEHTEGVLRCLSELRRLSLEDYANRARIINQNGITIIKTAMMNHSTSSGILAGACRLLHTLVSYNGGQSNYLSLLSVNFCRFV